MEELSEKKKRLQWHPAFFAVIQIELAEFFGNIIL